MGNPKTGVMFHLGDGMPMDFDKLAQRVRPSARVSQFPITILAQTLDPIMELECGKYFYASWFSRTRMCWDPVPAPGTSHRAHACQVVLFRLLVHEIPKLAV